MGMSYFYIVCQKYISHEQEQGKDDDYPEISTYHPENKINHCKKIRIDQFLSYSIPHREELRMMFCGTVISILHKLARPAIVDMMRTNIQTANANARYPSM